MQPPNKRPILHCDHPPNRLEQVAQFSTVTMAQFSTVTDTAAPSTRLWDLAYAAQAFTLSDTNQAPEEAAQNLTAFTS